MANNNHFNLTLDTLAPTGSISRPTQYVHANPTLTIDSGDATFMALWFDTNASGTLPVSPTWIAADSSHTAEFVSDGTYYYHMALMDDLGNISSVYNTDIITFDTTAPTVSNVAINDGAAITNNRNVDVSFEFADTLSGCVSYTISGDLASTVSGDLSAAQILAGEATIAVTLSGSGAEDTSKIVSVTVTDASGNTSLAVTDSIILDTIGAAGNIILRDETDDHNINSTWVNDADFILKVEFAEDTTTHEYDVVGYKVWGDFNADGSAVATTEPADYTAVAKGTEVVSLTKKFTSGDSATKNVHAKIIDEAGNETTLTSVFASVDYSAPDVSIATNKVLVSLVSGFDEFVLTPTVDASIAGCKSFQWKEDGNNMTVSGASGNGAPVPLTVPASAIGAEGSHTFTLVVVDNANNSAESASVTVVKDITAPTGSITMAAWYNGDGADHTTYQAFSGAGATASATDDHTVAFMTCWCDTTADNTVVPGSATEVAYAANPVHSQIDWTGHAESGTNYIHIKYVDEVGNARVVHSAAFGIDTVAPNTGTITFDNFTLPGQRAYNSTAAHVAITYGDVTSGVSKMSITGNIVGASGYEDVAAAKSVTLATPDGQKVIYLQLKDLAGNYTTATFAQDTCELDTTAPSAGITLFQTDDTHSQPAITNLAEFIAHITGEDVDEQDPEPVEYKLYGDFTYEAQSEQGITEQAASWETLVKESGQNYMKIDDMFCTSGDGTKTIYLKIRDNAGNISSASASFEYDTTAPEVEVANVDYNRISLMQTLRRTLADGEIAGKYNDQIHFTITSTSAIQAYQICAYDDQAAAEAGDHTKGQVTADSRCVNISATGLSLAANTPVAVTLSGAAYKAALEDDSDGLHIVVAYVQDLGGTWSVAAQFEVDAATVDNSTVDNAVAG